MTNLEPTFSPTTAPAPYGPGQPTPQESPLPYAPTPYVPAPVAVDPGRTLGIVGLVLSFVTALVGLVFSIVALRRSRRAGFRNGFALAGTVVGGLGTLAVVVAVVVGGHLRLTEHRSRDRCGLSVACSSVRGMETAWLRRGLGARAVPPPVDAAVAGAFLLIVLAEARLSPAVREPSTFVALAGPTAVLLAWRRRFPLLVTAVAVAANLVLNPTGQLSLLLLLVLVTYTVGSTTTRPWNVVGLLLVVVPFVGVNLARGLEPSDLAAGLVFFVGPWLVGTVVRGRVERSAEAEARAGLREERAAAEAARAVAEERTRIARELHDIVSHSISVVTIQTQAVRRRLHADQVSEAADLAAVETVARDALTEMRRLLGVLRARDDRLDLAPQPHLADVDRLVTQASTAAVPVRLRVEGEPVPLPAGLDLTAYRIVQEGVTNALRHAAASRVDVVVRWSPEELGLEVVDDGRGPPGERRPGDGHGLVGVRERVSLYGGAVELAEAPSGGTRLAARLPLGRTSWAPA